MEFFSEVAYLVGEISLLSDLFKASPAPELALRPCFLIVKDFGRPESPDRVELELTTFKKWILFPEVMGRTL